ncbi:hypothetical protein BC940DRAFT_291179 [Gongronella butleri]|nr:hypothetical protein BC940DRAFT_291179 [Gongronella butleri]
MEETWSQYKIKPANSDLFAEDASIIYVPSGTTAQGRAAIRRMYLQSDFSQKTTSVNEVVHHQVKTGNRIIEEAEWILSFHHGTCSWLVPGIEEHQLANAMVKIPVVISAEFEDNLIRSVRYYWDQASVLKQLRLISDRNKLPVLGVEQVGVFTKQGVKVATSEDTTATKLPEKFNPGKNAFVPGRVFGPVHPDDEVGRPKLRGAAATSVPQRNIFTYEPPEQKPLVAHDPKRLDSSFSFGHATSPTTPEGPAGKKMAPANRNIFAPAADDLAKGVQALNVGNGPSRNNAPSRNIFTHE